MTDSFPTDTSTSAGGDPQPPTPRFAAAAAGVMIGAIVVLLIVIALTMLGDDPNQVDTTDTTSPTDASSTESSSAEPSSTETSSSEPSSTDASSTETSTTETSSTETSSTETSTTTTSTTTATTTATTDPATYRSAVWPWVDSSTRYADPVDAARGFAEDLVGFTDPIVGTFQQGDGRSGEVEVRPEAGGPVTVVLVRQLGPDDTWWVLGSVTGDITVERPSTLAVVESPLTVVGTALAFEGHVGVVMVADGSLDPLIDGYVVGGGSEPGAFETAFEWSNPGNGAGALVLLTTSAEDGQVWEAAVRRVLFE